MTFNQQVKQLAEQAVLKFFSDGNWLQPSYENRIKVPPEFTAEVWQMVDFEKVKQQLVVRIEQELANKLVNHIAAELSTDIKKILSVQERREEIRAVARENLKRICKGEVDFD